MTQKSTRRLIAALSASAMIFSTISSVDVSDVFSADPLELPDSLEAPDIIIYDQGNDYTDLAVSALTPASVLDFYEKSDTNSYTEDDKTISKYGEWYFDSASAVQVDWKIDDGQWQYQTDWNDDVSNSGDYTWEYFRGDSIVNIDIGSASTWLTSGITVELDTLGCLTSTTDGEYTYYRFDTENHKISVRARYMVKVRSDSDEPKHIFSEWSDIAEYGNGSRTDTVAQSDLTAPVIKNFKIDSTNYDKSPSTSFDVYPENDVRKTFMWSKQYDSDFKYNQTSLIIEASTDPKFGEGATIVSDYYNTPKRHLAAGDIFYDIWWNRPDSDRQAFCWNGETVYLRAKWKNARTVNDKDSSIESPYSNILSVKGPVVGTHSVTVTHEPFGLKTESSYSESYKITEGRELHDIFCSPVEGCYVDTITVNDVVMYDHDDESTHELLDRWDSDRIFAFKDDDKYAVKDLNIVITYSGKPTAKFGVTTEQGTGGYLTSSGYDSWDDNSLVVFHGTAPKIDIHAHYGYEIDKVMIDGKENAQAKADASYTFPAVTDNTHSISVTFRRISYEIDSYTYHGKISTDYPGYDDSDYVKTGDDITFTFKPEQDSSGNYYEIEAVYIDGVVNNDAKASGTYTFKNVQANHSIRVDYSDDPVITHDITASSGKNGSISPEGIIHVREGSTQRFNFIPDPGYETDVITVDGTDIKNPASKEYFNIPNITGNHTINVTFKKIPVKYNVDVIVSGDNPSVHKVNPAGTTPLQAGDDFTVTYSPFTGYETEKVLVNGTEVTANGTYSLKDISSDCTIEIFFRIKNYNVTFTDYDGTVLKKETVKYGNTVKAPDDPVREHYVFDGWDTDFSGITANVTIRATYRPAKYTVKFIGWDGTVLKSEVIEYAGNAAAPVPPEREGYDFSNWSHDYTNIGSDLSITAVYKQKQYTVSFTDSDDTVISTQTVKHGEAAVAPTAPAKEGWKFAGWDNIGYGHVTQNMTIKATYTEEISTTYSITARALGSTGTVSPNGSTTVLENGSLKIQFTPDSFSKIERVVVDSTEIPVCSFYTFDNITSDHTIDVYFAPTAVINIKKDSIKNGSVTGRFEIVDGTTAYILNITPNSGYETEGIYINDKPVELEKRGNDYIIHNLSEDMDIDVRFKSIATVTTVTTAATTPVPVATTTAITTVSTTPAASTSVSTTPSPEATATVTANTTSASVTTSAIASTTSSADTTTTKNDTKNSPKTGDTKNMAPWFILFCLSAASLFSTTYGKKKKAEK